MGWLNVPPFNISTAEQRGYDVWELLYSDWGLLNVNNNGSTAFPPIIDASLQSANLGIPVTVAGIAIGEKSTVDRCWASYNLSVPAPQVNPDTVDTRTNRLREISVDSPLIFSQPSVQNGGKMAFTDTGFGTVEDPLLTMVKYGSLYVWPWDINPFAAPPTQTEPYHSMVNRTVYPESFTDCNNVVRDFPPDSPTDFVGPLLHLYFYLKGPNIAIPTKRAPLLAGKDFETGQFTANTEHLAAVVATFGRKTLHIMLRCDQLSSFRIGALRVPGSDVAVILNTYEEPLDQALNVAASVPTVLASCNQDDVKADYITIYVTPKAPNAQFSYRLTAYD